MSSISNHSDTINSAERDSTSNALSRMIDVGLAIPCVMEEPLARANPGEVVSFGDLRRARPDEAPTIFRLVGYDAGDYMGSRLSSSNFHSIQRSYPDVFIVLRDDDGRSALAVSVDFDDEAVASELISLHEECAILDEHGLAAELESQRSSWWSNFLSADVHFALEQSGIDEDLPISEERLCDMFYGVYRQLFGRDHDESSLPSEIHMTTAELVRRLASSGTTPDASRQSRLIDRVAFRDANRLSGAPLSEHGVPHG